MCCSIFEFSDYSHRMASRADCYVSIRLASWWSYADDAVEGTELILAWNYSSRIPFLSRLIDNRCGRIRLGKSESPWHPVLLARELWMHALWWKISFFLFHPGNYYKLSLCVTFSNTFDNLCKSWRAYALENYGTIRYTSLFNRHVVFTSFMSLVANMLGCSSILSYLWLSLLISSLTYVEMHDAEYHWWRTTVRWQWGIWFEIFGIFLHLSWKLCSTVGRHKLRWVQELPCATAIYFRSTVAIYLVASTFCSIEFEAVFCLVNMYFLQFSLRS